MGNGKRFIGLFTAALLLAVVIFWKSESAWDGTVGITAVVASASGSEEISCWEGKDKMFYLFLPSYADPSQVTLERNTTAEVLLEGTRLEDVTFSDLELDTPYRLQYQWRGKTYAYGLTLMQSQNLPALYVDTASETMDIIHEQKGNSEPGRARLYTQSGEQDWAGNLEAVKGRGNSTWEEAKKPYNLTLNTDGDLLGMGAAKKWILLANAKDATHLRNKIVYDFARQAGLPYTPESRWVDVYLNGEYAGLYLLCERNEVHEQRVNISREDSFLVSKDWRWRLRDNGHPYFQTDGEVALRIHHSGMEQESLEALWQQAENAILAEDGVDPVSGRHWQELIDLDSWARKYLIEEVFANTDAATLSQYFYYDGTAEGKIFAGPVWDYDLAIANVSSAPNMLFADRPNLYGSPWYSALCRQEVFQNRVTELYETEFLPLLKPLLEETIPSYTAQIRNAAAMDQLRWNTGNLEAEAEGMLDYLQQRTVFLNSLWIEQEDYIYVEVTSSGGLHFRFALRPGETLPPLPEYKSSDTRIYYGWFDQATGLPVDVTGPIYEEIRIEQRYEDIEAPEEAPAEEEPFPLRRLLWSGLLALLFAGVFLWDRRHFRGIPQEKNLEKELISPMIDGKSDV